MSCVKWTVQYNHKQYVPIFSQFFLYVVHIVAPFSIWVGYVLKMHFCLSWDAWWRLWLIQPPRREIKKGPHFFGVKKLQGLSTLSDPSYGPPNFKHFKPDASRRVDINDLALHQLLLLAACCCLQAAASSRQFNDVWSLDLRCFTWQKLCCNALGEAPPVELELKEQHFRATGTPLVTALRFQGYTMSHHVIHPPTI